MTDVQHGYGFPAVIYFVGDAVVANPKAPPFSCSELEATLRSRILGKLPDGVANMGIRLGEIVPALSVPGAGSGVSSSLASRIDFSNRLLKRDSLIAGGLRAIKGPDGFQFFQFFEYILVHSDVEDNAHPITLFIGIVSLNCLIQFSSRRGTHTADAKMVTGCAEFLIDRYQVQRPKSGSAAMLH